ncbi:MAG: hypothetical protein ACKVK0_02620 [Pirellulales bacterium]|jgi:hypothetical protein
MIQFECPHCREILKVPEARADTEAVCSGCHKPVRIPPIVNLSNGTESMPSAPPVIQNSEPVAPSATPGPDGGEEMSPQETNEDLIDSGGGRVEVPNKHFDDLEERVKRAQQGNSHADKIHRHTRDHALVGVSRATIVIFVALLGCVALTSFWIGTMIDPVEESVLASLGPGVGLVQCKGRVTYRTADDPEAVDTQALVFLLPEGSLPSEKFSIADLVPGDDVSDTLATIEEIRRLGGQFAVTDDAGRFTTDINLGRYYLLVISANQAAVENPRPKEIATQKKHLDELGLYFELPAKLLSNHRYRWSLEVVNTHRDIRVYFR